MIQHSQHQLPFNPHEIIFERKFDIALRESHARHVKPLLLACSGGSYDVQLLRQSLQLCYPHNDTTDIINNLVCNVNIWPHIFLSVIRTSSVGTQNETYKEVSNLINQTILIQTRWIQQGAPILQHDNLQTYLQEVEDNRINDIWVSKLIAFAKQMERVVSSLSLLENVNTTLSRADRQKQQALKCYRSLPQWGITFVWSRQSVIIAYNNKFFLLPRAYVLLIHNKTCDIISVLLYAMYTPLSCYKCPLYQVTQEFILELMELSNRYKNKFFPIVKVLESIIIGETLISLEGKKNAAFLRTITNALEEDTGYDYPGSHLQEIILSVPNPVKQELSCLSKICGHPFCDITQAAEDLKTKTRERRPIVPDAVLQSIRYAKKDFIHHYIVRHKKWPRVTFEERNLPLARACFGNLDPSLNSTMRRVGNIDILDFDYVTLEPNLTFDYVENFIPYIKDRAISMLKTDVIHKYLDEMPVNVPWTDTRALLAFLLWPDYKSDHMMYLQEYIAGGWDQIANYLIIRLVPKEKELKTSARCFGCKSFQDRARSIIQELNAADFLHKYSTEEAMTLGDHELTKKLLAFRNMKKAYPGYKSIIINVDSSSWNNRFRHEAVAPITAEVLDNVYHVPIFSKTHQAFRKSFIYLPDIDKVHYWDGQEGGIEGLNQYTWVWTYISQVKVMMEDFHLPYYILCKGDDLRIIILLPPQELLDHTIDELKNRILTTLSRVAAQFGHVVRTEDSYASESYFAFSKQAFIHNVELPQTYRKIQKCYGANNAFLTTIDDYIGSSFSNAHSASLVSGNVLGCYAVALLWSFLQLEQSTLYKSLSHAKQISLMMIPNMLNGFPIIYLHNFLVRSESDLLVPFLDLLLFVRLHFPDVYSEMNKFTYQLTQEPGDSFMSLMVDIYTLPLKRLTNPTTFLRNKVAITVGRLTKNTALQELYALVSEGLDEQLLNILESARPCVVKLLSAIYDTSPASIIAELTRKFESGRSILNFLLLSGGRRASYRVLKQANSHNIRLQKSRVDLLNRIGSLAAETSFLIAEDWTVCSTEAAQNVRCRLWKRQISTVTSPCVQHLVTIDRMSRFTVTDHNALNHFDYQWSTPPSFEANKYGSSFLEGDVSPFYGATTGSGLQTPQAPLIQKNIMSLKVHALLSLYKWSQSSKVTAGTVITSNVPDLIESIIYCYTGRPLDTLLPHARQRIIGPTMQHHLRSYQYRTRVVPNIISNYFTCIQGTTLSHTLLTNSLQHYLINFHQIMCHLVACIALWQILHNKTLPSTRVWAVTARCNYCLQPVTEDPVVLRCCKINVGQLTKDSHIGVKAIQELLSEVEEFQQTQTDVRPLGTENMTLHMSFLALASYYMDRMVQTRNDIQSHATEHHLSTEGLQQLVNWRGQSHEDHIDHTTFRAIPMDVLIDAVVPIIRYHIHVLIKSASPDVMLFQLSMIPSEELPWTEMLLDIAKSGRFYELTLYVCQTSSNKLTSNYDNPVSFSASFGVYCYTRSKKFNFPVYIPIIRYTLTEDITPFLAKRIRALQVHYIRMMVLPEVEQGWKIPQLREHAVRKLILSTLMTDNYDVGYDLFDADDPSPVPRKELTFLDTGLGLDDQLALIQEDRNDCPLAFHVLAEPWLLSRDVPIEDHLDFLLNNVNERDKLITELYKEHKAHKFIVFKTDLISCVNNVKLTLIENIPGRVYTQQMIPNTSVPKINGSACLTFRTVNFESQVASINPILKSHLPLQLPSEPDPTFSLSASLQVRLIGSNNISASRMGCLFDLLGIHQLPDYQNYLTLGDGYGNTASVIASLTSHSNIIFNTKPNNPGNPPAPNVALNANTNRSNLITWENVKLGYYDLTEESTFEFLETEHQQYALITLDMEVISSSAEEIYERAWVYVAQFFVRNSLEGGCLILKLYIMHFPAVLKVLSVLSQYSTNIWFTPCVVNRSGGEIYLIAQCGHVLHKPPYSLWKFYPPYRQQARLYHWVNKMYFPYTKLHQSLSQLDIEVPIPPIIKHLSYTCPSYGLTKLMEVLKIDIPYRLRRRQSVPVNIWLDQWENVLDAHIREAHKELRNTEVTRSDARFNTLAHKLTIFGRLVALESGSRLVIPACRPPGHELINNLTVPQKFLDYLQLQHRWHFSFPLTQFLEGPQMYHGYRVNFFQNWVCGLRLFYATIRLAYHT
nr:MAG: RNA-dependent RNA polymerase [Wufeng shrew chuvirus 6]